MDSRSSIWIRPTATVAGPSARSGPAVPDSHMNSYIRFKLALTENEPVIKPYMEDLWAELPEARARPSKSPLALLDALHQRWTLRCSAN